MAPNFIPSIASQSLGRAWNHRLEDKLAACARYRYEAIELFHEDLVGVAKTLPSTHPAASAGSSFLGSSVEQERELAAADYIHQLCVRYKLDILCLQPFMHYDGLVDASEHQSRIEKLHFWMKLADRLHTDLIQVPSNFLPESQCTGDRERIVADLQEAADIGLQHTPTIRFAYEALCWGTYVDLWDQAWDVVKAVDRPNFGTCLDTFNLAGRVYADPTVSSGKTANAEVDIKASIQKLRTQLDATKVFYVEVCDGERLDQPLLPGHPWYNKDQKARMSWSRNARLFPFEERGYLPCMEILEAICDAGFTGYVSFELFSRTANMAGPNVPEEHARRGQVAWNKMCDYMKWDRHISNVPVEQVSSTIGRRSTFAKTTATAVYCQPITLPTPQSDNLISSALSRTVVSF